MYPQVFGKYVLERELARGGMARVVLATLRGAGGFEKKLVVKQIRDDLACDEDFVRRFVQEAKTNVALAHPNIVPVYELGVELGTYFLAMEFVEGASLAELLRATDLDSRPLLQGRRIGLSPEEGAYVGVEVCRALDYAHRRMNVVHRDVTPRNVMVDEEGQVKVIDFGIAAPVATAASGQGVFGSPGHMPPEQMDGKELTPAADVFAVAVLLMELWSGKPPFRRRTAEDIQAAMHAAHPKPSDADIRLLPLDSVIASAMSLDSSARPQQADDLGRALRRFLAGVDLGDLAHQLGERVRIVRSHPPPAIVDQRPLLQRPPSRPTATQVGTKTFAARDEVRSLRPAGANPEASTRKVASTPLPVRGREVDTLAMRPLETDPQKAANVPPRRMARLGVAGAGALVVAAFLLGRGAATRGMPAATTAPSGMGTASAVIGETSSTTLRPLPPTSGASTVVVLAPPPVVTASPERAQLVLLGDGTRVAVDGVPRGGCPARVAVDPGPHAVLFTFPTTGESKGESLTLRAGERATLHADFTGATPTIRTER
jgi:serine/threonine-protein kinase